MCNKYSIVVKRVRDLSNPIEKLKISMHELTDTQKKVADFIIKNPMDVAFYTVDQLAGIVGTSTTTIMRLTFSLGYSGYSEFQKGLQEILRSKAAPHTRLEANLKDLTKNDLWVQYVDFQINSIQNTFDVITNESLEKTIKVILNARNIYCTGVRSGLPVAQYLTHGLNRLLGNTKLQNADQSDWIDDVAGFDSSDVVIAISYPRYARRIIDLVSQAKKADATVIAITDSYSSPLAKHADLILPCNSSSLSFHNSITTSIFLVDYLITAVAAQNHEKIKSRLDKVNDILTEINYHHLPPNH